MPQVPGGFNVSGSVRGSKRLPADGATRPMSDNDSSAGHLYSERRWDVEGDGQTSRLLAQDCESQCPTQQQSSIPIQNHISKTVTSLSDLIYRLVLRVGSFICSLIGRIVSTAIIAPTLACLFLAFVVLGIPTVLDLRQGLFPVNKVIAMGFIVIGIAICSRLRFGR
jgi:hypothetical protein